jgi:tetratricopeptide (TPR) repeat protein
MYLIGDRQGSDSDFNRAIAIKPNHDGAYANRGVAYMGQKNYQQGLADVEKALQINPSNDTAYQGRSTISVPKISRERSLMPIGRSPSILYLLTRTLSEDQHTSD